MKYDLAHTNGCVHKPLVTLLMENIITDEVHIMSRITDRLLGKIDTGSNKILHYRHMGISIAI